MKERKIYPGKKKKHGKKKKKTKEKRNLTNLLDKQQLEG